MRLLVLKSGVSELGQSCDFSLHLGIVTLCSVSKKSNKKNLIAMVGLSANSLFEAFERFLNGGLL